MVVLVGFDGVVAIVVVIIATVVVLVHVVIVACVFSFVVGDVRVLVGDDDDDNYDDDNDDDEEDHDGHRHDRDYDQLVGLMPSFDIFGLICNTSSAAFVTACSCYDLASLITFGTIPVSVESAFVHIKFPVRVS